MECRKWGFKRWGFKEIRGYLRKKAFFLRFLDFPGALRTLRKRAKKAEKGRKRPISGRFLGRAARHPLNPHLLHPHLWRPKNFWTDFFGQVFSRNFRSFVHIWALGRPTAHTRSDRTQMTSTQGPGLIGTVPPTPNPQRKPQGPGHTRPGRPPPRNSHGPGPTLSRCSPQGRHLHEGRSRG